MKEPLMDFVTGETKVLDTPFPPEMVPCIEDFFLWTHPKLPTGLDVYPEVFQTSLFFPLQRMRETAWMIQQARKINPITVMEIGADKGGGLYHWCKCFPTVKNVIACEIRGTPYRHQFEIGFPRTDFLWLEQSSYSHVSLSQVAAWLRDTPIDVLFIDGDKNHFHTDFVTYRPLLARNAIVFFHDIQDEEPRRGFKEVIKAFGYDGLQEEFVDVQEAADAVARQHEGKPAANAHEAWLRYWHGRSCGVGAIYLGGKS